MPYRIPKSCYPCFIIHNDVGDYEFKPLERSESSLFWDNFHMSLSDAPFYEHKVWIHKHHRELIELSNSIGF